MTIPSLIAKHLRDVHFGGNWTDVNLKATLAGINWQQATEKIHSFNTIATLVYHTNYYIAAVTNVLRGQPLNAKDKDSFEHPPITSEEDWQALQAKTWRDAEEFAALIEQLPEDQLQETFADEKYGTYYHNLHGIIEHLHYHLGQIVLLKKLLSTQ
ncbi:MAG TPA: DinB family protein [Flavisolibacter sp.]|nr:DinB family protein [Flavisolibacter sp.]